MEEERQIPISPHRKSVAQGEDGSPHTPVRNTEMCGLMKTAGRSGSLQGQDHAEQARGGAGNGISFYQTDLLFETMCSNKTKIN